MKIIVRNLLSIFRRFKTATFLNILGLSIAFTVFLVSMMQVLYDLNYDRFHKNADNIYRLELVLDNGTPQAVISRPLIDAFIKSSPHIKNGALYFGFGGNSEFTIDEEGEPKIYKEQFNNIYPDFLKIFDFQFIHGDTLSFRNPDAVLLPESIAKKIFNKTSVIGEHLKIGYQSWTIVGVYKDFPGNSSVKNVFYKNIDQENLGNWENYNYNCFVLLDSPEFKDLVVDNFIKEFKENNSSNTNVRLSLLSDVYYDKEILFDNNAQKGSKPVVYLLLAIGLLIITIATINFTNFATALTPLRIKNINTQKVLGSSDKSLRLTLIAESVGVSLISYLISLGILFFISTSSLASFVSADIHIGQNVSLVVLSGVFSLLVGLFAGLYPAFYMTSFSPAMVLKGSFGLSPKGQNLRNVLVAVQFVASLALISGALFMFLQNNYMRNAPLGFDKDQIAIVRVNRQVFANRESYVNKLKSFSGIDEVGFAETLFGGTDEYMNWGCQYLGKNIKFDCIPVLPGFLKTMGIEVAEGRDFVESDKETQYGVYIFNRKAKELYDLEIGKGKVQSGDIVGIVPNIKFTSLRLDDKPMAFYIYGKENNWGSEARTSYIRIKSGADVRSAVGHIEKTLKEIDNTYPFEIRFYDTVFDYLYSKEKNLSFLIYTFGLIAVFLSIVGVFGLVVFESQYRKKEIGIRKVMGATTNSILYMFNKIYVRILLICFVIAIPITYLPISKWLENFKYKIPVYWWVFLIAFALVLIITVMTVSFQTWRSANENPVDSVKNE